MADTLPPEVTLSVPRAFQDYVTRRQSKRYLLAFAGCIGLFVLLPLALKSSPVVDASALFLLINAVVWFATRNKIWQYKINAQSMNLFCLKPHWSGTLWQDIGWNQDQVMNVEQDEWRGLPALRITTKTRGINYVQDLWMVYAREDADTVQNVVLPLIEQYRKEYRHPLWADTLRQEKP